MLRWDADEVDVRAAERDERREAMGDAKREADELAHDAPDSMSRAERRCECGVRSPNVYCPRCRRRLRPPGSAGEIRWMRNHGYEPTATDLRRFPDA